MKVVITHAGDRFDTIAAEALGDTAYTEALMLANPQYLHLDTFETGTELRLPQELPEIKPQQTILPPWKSTE